MKKKLAVLIVIIVMMSIWWSSPVYFLKDVHANDVLKVEVFNGNSGEYFTIENEDDISYLVSNIQQTTLKRNKLSLGYMGTLFQLKFYDVKGKEIDAFIINYYDTIRKDPFFYRDSTGNLCVDYLKDLERSFKKK